MNTLWANFYGGTSLLILVGVILDTLQQILLHINENLNIMPIVYGPAFVMVGNRITGVVTAKAPSSNVILWNTNQWDVTS